MTRPKLSATYKRPAESNAKPEGCTSADLLICKLFGGWGPCEDVKLDWPSTKSAVGSIVLAVRFEAGKRNTRLLPGSVTQTFPCASRATPARNAVFPEAKYSVLLLGPGLPSFGDPFP